MSGGTPEQLNILSSCNGMAKLQIPRELTFAVQHSAVTFEIT